MPKRKKRLEKGIESIDEQIKIHEEKLAKAKDEGNLDLEDYYDREIQGLKKSKERKEKQLGF
jgi:hypothetical protein